MFGTRTEPDQSHVRSLTRGHRSHVGDVDLAGDHLVSEPGHDVREKLQTIGTLIRNQHPEMVDPVHSYLPLIGAGHENGRKGGAARLRGRLA